MDRYFSSTTENYQQNKPTKKNSNHCHIKWVANCKERWGSQSKQKKRYRCLLIFGPELCSRFVLWLSLSSKFSLSKRGRKKKEPLCWNGKTRPWVLAPSVSRERQPSLKAKEKVTFYCHNGSVMFLSCLCNTTRSAKQYCHVLHATFQRCFVSNIVHARRADSSQHCRKLVLPSCQKNENINCFRDRLESDSDWFIIYSRWETTSYQFRCTFLEFLATRTRLYCLHGRSSLR